MRKMLLFSREDDLIGFDGRLIDVVKLCPTAARILLTDEYFTTGHVS